MSLNLRIIATAGIFVAGGIARSILSPVATIGAAVMAGHQFDNSDASAVISNVGMNFFSGIGGAITLAVAAALLLVWWSYIKLGFKNLTMSAILVTLMFCSPAKAYFDTSDRTEAYTIMPNESAFWIPDIGANKDSQTSMDSEAYFQANKIALKRFIIPHTKLNGSGGWGTWDDYIPAGRLIIVDRSPYNREWNQAANKGTSSKDEGIQCQTNDGINITTAVSVGASVSEDNAAKFLHYFGINNPGGVRTEPAVIFASVYYGRSLEQVMDGVGRGLVETAICEEFGKRDFSKANLDYNAIMDASKTTATKFLADRGVTVDYMGWAGTWGFDQDVQRAINDKYTGMLIAPVLPTLQQKAQIDALEGWDHHLPTSVSLSWWPSSLGEAVSNLFGSSKK